MPLWDSFWQASVTHLGTRASTPPQRPAQRVQTAASVCYTFTCTPRVELSARLNHSNPSTHVLTHHGICKLQPHPAMASAHSGQVWHKHKLAAALHHHPKDLEKGPGCSLFNTPTPHHAHMPSTCTLLPTHALMCQQTPT
jgi:hypothetical protein